MECNRCTLHTTDLYRPSFSYQTICEECLTKLIAAGIMPRAGEVVDHSAVAETKPRPALYVRA